MKLPPLPPTTSTFQRFDGGKIVRAHTDAAMRDYGALCRRVALEEALEVVNLVCAPDATLFGDGYNLGALDCAKAIKELK